MMIEEKYQQLLNTSSDVNKHFPLIRKSVEKGDTVIELGVRECVSTWALLAGLPAGMVSVDIVEPPKERIDEVIKACAEANIGYKFMKEDSIYARTAPFDVLFVDTLHFYSQIVKELWRHSGNVRKRIIFHDSNIPEVRACIQDFLFNLDWRFEIESPADTGLVVLKRVSRPIW